jgi:hypothetical protein
MPASGQLAQFNTHTYQHISPFPVRKLIGFPPPLELAFISCLSFFTFSSPLLPVPPTARTLLTSPLRESLWCAAVHVI